jgi:hypothetical protein
LNPESPAVVELKGGLSRYWWMLSPPMGRLRVSRDQLEIYSTLGDIVPPLRVHRDEVGASPRTVEASTMRRIHARDTTTVRP